MHVIELVTISAQPANQEAVRNRIALMKAITLAARIEERVDRAIFAARENEANQKTRVVAVAKEAR